MDLRDHIQRLKDVGDLIEVDGEVDWNLEAAAIESMMGRLNGPALLFNRIKGIREGRLLSGHFRGRSILNDHRRAAIALGMDPDINWQGFRDECVRRFSSPIPPMEVSTGPCKENIVMGEEVNLFAFPFPYIHFGDGGRAGTLQAWIGKDPDIAWTNWGNYRIQFHSRNKLGGLLLPGKHMADMFYLKYEPRGQPMPVCIAIGGDPAITLAGVIPVPRGQNEADYAGALRGEPMELVRAETNELLVPANAEIVIEGEMRPHERVDEGPFGEFIGFMHGPRVPRPVLRVTCITYRNNPIVPFEMEGDAAAGTGRCFGYIFTLGSYLAFKNMRLPVSRLDTWIGTMPGFLHMGLFLPPTTELPPGLTASILSAGPGLGFTPAFGVIAYDDTDTKPYDWDSALESFFLKTHPDNFRITPTDMPKSPINVYLTPDEKRRGVSAPPAIDTQWPAHWYPDKIPQRPRFENSFPQDVQEWARANWEKLGFGDKARAKA